jgi:hypothetical protein
MFNVWPKLIVWVKDKLSSLGGVNLESNTPLLLFVFELNVFLQLGLGLGWLYA